MEDYFGSFTDFTYDFTSEQEECIPEISPLPHDIIDLPNQIFAKQQQQNFSKKEVTQSKLNTSQDSYQSSYQIDDETISVSSSSADFEIDIIKREQKTKQSPNVNLNTLIYGFPKPISEVHRPFVTHKAPLSKKGKDSLQQDYVHLKNRLSSRRNLHLRSSTSKQHEFILSDISDL